jgi:DNA-binding CsgD family transcriptional regulator
MSLDINAFAYQDKYTDDIRDIAGAFFEQLNATFFSHVRVSHHGMFKVLMSETSLSKHYVDQRLPIRFSYGKGIRLHSGCYLLNGLCSIATPEQLDLNREIFNFDHFIYLVDKQETWDDLFILATTPENNAFENLVLNNLDFIKHGLHYYKYKTRKIFTQAPGVLYPSHYFMQQEALLCNKLHFDTDRLQKILVSIKGVEIVISRQEYRCLGFFTKNLTVKEIAQEMNLSPRTVETYLNNLKNKLRCQNSLELANIASNSYLF